MSGSVRASGRAWIPVSVGVIALVSAACGSSGSKTAAPGTAPSTTRAPVEAVVSPHGVKVIPGSATGNSPCEKASPEPASPGQVGTGEGGSESAGGHGETRGMLEQLPLAPAERQVLEDQIGAAKRVAEKYPTVNDALAAGYVKSTPYVPCIGAHYTNVALIPKFDPEAPSELLYEGTDPDSRIVGLSYLVWHPGGAPEGFAGGNDHWHQHNANGGLCLKGGVVVAGEGSTREQCAKLGGRKTLLTDIWMVHAWVVPGVSCTWGMFAGECPSLGGRVGGTRWDPPAPRDG
jgi:hypothetical protein